ncbi:MAG: hypothetical protein AABW92_05670, partial [Nanoarchaeota archaeon]
FHVGKYIIRSILLKEVTGTALLVGTIAVFLMFTNIPYKPFGVPHVVVGAAFGLLLGLFEAFGGAEKDAPFEGFEPLKVFRSPLVDLTWGAIFSLFSVNYGLIFLATGGAGRMTIEFYKTFVVKKVPGKFKASEPPFKDWINKRVFVVFPYFLTWIVFFALFYYSYFGTFVNLVSFMPIFIGIIVGIHAGSYGAYKNSPYEGFKIMRVIREIFFATLIGTVIYLFNILRGINYFLLFLVIFACSRLLTEFYKLFIRTESQKIYKIPTQIHSFGKVVTNPIFRIIIGILPVFILVGVYFLGVFLIKYLPIQGVGIIVGLIMGCLTAIAGGYKDGFFEGFDKIKFLRSPSLTMLGGFIVSYFTAELYLIMLGSIGFERLMVELYKAFLKKNYWPGKFGEGKVLFPEWKVKRNMFIPSYFFTWFCIIGLLFL